MYESNLVPVVGFHSNGESVRVNFGVLPFTYEVCVATFRLEKWKFGGRVATLSFDGIFDPSDNFFYV